MNLVQNIKLFLDLLLKEIRVEIMFDDRLVTNRSLLDYKKGPFGQVAILEFSKGGPYEFSLKLKNYSFVSFWRKYA